MTRSEKKITEIFLPASADDLRRRGWDSIDILIVTGDAYVDHPSFGAAVIGRYLEHAGYRVAICDAVTADDGEKIRSFGVPRLFYGVTAGNVDSSLMRYTAFGKIRNDDPFLPERLATKRPERATIGYCNMIKQITKDVPIIIGGIEASMRRFAHFDFASGKLRRSIIEDSRADLLVYGNGEIAIVEAAKRIAAGENLNGIAGTMIIRKDAPGEGVEITREEEMLESKERFAEGFAKIYLNGRSILFQKTAARFIVQYPPHEMNSEEIDSVYQLPFVRKVHPAYEKEKIAAFEMIKFSINSHRGCVSGCAFCSLALHHGRRIVSRSEKSCIEEAERIAGMDYFKGHITDVGGPSANMYRSSCAAAWRCSRESCLYPQRCKNLKTEHSKWLALIKKISALAAVKHVTVGSGIRYDLMMHDAPTLLDEIVENHISGQMKVAPEHSEDEVLRVMRKKPIYPFEKFVKNFGDACERKRVKRYIIPYLMSNHPGSTMESMKRMKARMLKTMRFLPDQVQSFIPLPGTLSSVVYYTGIDPLTGEKIFSEHDRDRKRKQHGIFFSEK